MKKRIIMLAAITAVSAASAAPILWDISSGAAANTNATVAEFTLAGVTEDLTGATVSHVLGSPNTTMTNANGVTLGYLNGESAVNMAVNATTMTGAGWPIIKEYLYHRDRTTPLQMQIGGLSSQLDADTDYSLYIWAVGDNVDQGSIITFDGTTIALPGADADDQPAANYAAKFSFNTGATVADTLDFDWEKGTARWAGLNGFAIVEAIPEPATLGMVAVFGGGIFFIRRRFKI
ncbi:PEP-CTERM sorting domain-containing protein [Pontiellaceae bacterium B1224]|nr:PEP-CTERM sorting domain-containing protein [Pontiellaceae bacterium B1224]